MTSHPNFSGRWQFKATRSALEIPRPDVVLLVIEHDEPRFRLERTLAFGERTDTFAIDLRVGADQPPIARGTATLYPSLEWDGDQLVFRTRIVRPGEDEATNEVRYRLGQDGTALVADEHFASTTQHYDNRWVFGKDEPGARPAGA